MMIHYPYLILSFFCFFFGIYSWSLRFKNPRLFRALEPLRKRYGHRIGHRLQIFLYTWLPILVGLTILYLALHSKHVVNIQANYENYEKTHHAS